MAYCLGALSATQRLDSLQALRAIAAGAVVLSHLYFHAKLRALPVVPPQWFDYGYLGVDLFFVLSGWIIVHVHADDLGHAARAKDYLWRRVARVWPLLAVLTTGKLLSMYLAPGVVPTERLSASTIVTSYLCLPHPDWPVISVAWTLRHEALFYALFAVVIVLGKRAVWPLVACWVALIVAALSVSQGPYLFEFAGNALHLHFLFGCAAAWWLKRRPQQAPAQGPSGWFIVGLVGLLLLCVALHARLEPTSWSTLSRLPLGVVTALLIIALVRREQAAGVVVPRLIKQLGDASYSLYLWHGFVVGGMCWLWTRLPDELRSTPLALVWLAATLLGAFASSLLLHQYLERPLVAWFQSWRPSTAKRKLPA